jgi:selenocysteine lyase/cysteine desulfurase
MDFKEIFPVLKNSVYLNTASSGILSRDIINWRQKHDEEFEQQGSGFRLNQAAFLMEVKRNVARFFGAAAEHTFLVPNCSFAFNTFLDGLERGHRFLLLASDYPSVNYPVESRGFPSKQIVLDGSAEENVLKQMELFKPTVFAFSLVQYTNGAKISTSFLKGLKTQYPELLIIADGTQFCGTEKFDLESSGIDVLLSSGYKWMLSGYGNGFLLMKAHVRQYLFQDREAHPLPSETFLKDKDLLALNFEPGHLDTLSFGTLNQSVLFMEKLGMDWIEERIKGLTAKAHEAFRSRSLLAPALDGRAEHGAIFNLLLEDGLIAKIMAANISCLSRGQGLRVAFHFYNEESDLAALLAVIDDWTGNS